MISIWKDMLYQELTKSIHQCLFIVICNETRDPIEGNGVHLTIRVHWQQFGLLNFVTIHVYLKV